MRLFTLILSCSLFLSCTLKHQFEKVGQIRSDLQTAFNYEDINVGFHSGTDPEDEKIAVTFYHFNLEKLSYQELTSLAARVGVRICTSNPDLAKSPLIEVNFTKAANSESAIELTTFKLKNPCKK